MSIAGFSQEKRKAVVRKESAETQDCEFCQQRMVLRWIKTRAWTGLREPLRVKHMCDKNCDKEGFKFFDIETIFGRRRREAAHDQYHPGGNDYREDFSN